MFSAGAWVTGTPRSSVTGPVWLRVGGGGVVDVAVAAAVAVEVGLGDV